MANTIRPHVDGPLNVEAFEHLFALGARCVPEAEENE
jgi:hypothetical protein